MNPDAAPFVPPSVSSPSSGGAYSQGALKVSDKTEGDRSVAKLHELILGPRGKPAFGVCPISFAAPPTALHESVLDDDVPQHQPSIVSRAMKNIVPLVSGVYSGHLSPRGGVGRGYTSLAPDKKVPLDMLLLSVDDIVSQIYVHFDEDMTKIILNALDQVTLAESHNQLDKLKQNALDDLIGTLGERHFMLIQCILEKPKEIFLRLLEEFCNIEDATAQSKQEHMPQFGASVRFVRSKRAQALSSDERWLKHMNKRFYQLNEESELNAILRKDFSMSGVTMPSNTTMVKFPEYLLFNVPPPEVATLPETKRINIKTQLPAWTHCAFGGVTALNTIQTKVFETAFHSNQNMLICAPTGAGKTMVALLVMLRQIQEQFHDGKLDKDFKIIFVAPMKALAAEMVTNFQKRLSGFNMIVRELTGDMQLTKKEIAETQVIVTTPEKWDVVTRKQSDNDVVKKAKLIIIDEIHLLNDERGPVIEALVARTLRQLEMDPTHHVRLVGLSATLPNYKDVATFLHVDLAEGLKVFGPEYRPVPLEQTFIGTNDTGRSKEAKLDELAYEAVVKNLQEGHQVMVFVHSRKQTITLAKYFVETAQKRHQQRLFTPEDLPNEVKKRGGKLQGRDLSSLFMAGVCVHHAGLIRFDRTTVEDLFRDGHFRVLICTATLAWGVNLPAHTVIIRGTEVYDPKRGGLVSISVLDVMQIFGRAGRPQYDTSGHGIIVSDIKQVSHYLRLIAHALPIESKFQSRLADHLNAEIHAGTVTSIAEGVRWLEYTYLWQRIRINPLSYGLTIGDVRRDPELRTIRSEFIASSAAALNEACMVRFNPDTGALDTTDLGRIASHYYIEHISMRTFNEQLRRTDGSFVDTLDLGAALNIIASANEFSQLRARQEELDELNKIHQMLPPRIRKVRIAMESADETSIQWKVTTLLKAYISRVPIDMHSLVADMNYIVQNGSRIGRALFEIELQRGHPHTTQTFLTICKSIERRCWDFDHPLFQFDYDFTDSVLEHLNTKRPSMSMLQEMTAKEIGSLVHNIRFGGIIEDLARKFPALEINAEVQPITRTILRVKVTITPNFTWEPKYHNGAEMFWLFVEDQGNNMIFHHEQFLLKKKDVQKKEPLVINLTIPIVPEYDMYCVRVYSDRWMGCEDEYDFSVAHLCLPDDAQPNTKLLPMPPLTKDVIPEEFHPIYTGFNELNAVQTQTFHAMYHTDANVFLGAPTGSGKTIAAEMAMLRVLKANDGGKIVYIAPLKALVKERLKDWSARFVKLLGKKVVELSGDVTPDIQALGSADILCTTPEKWDGISRNWQVRSYVKSVRLVVFDEIHMLGSDRGPIIEVIVSRMRYIGWHLGSPIRLIGLSTAVANPGDLAAWMGVDKKWAMFNFEPTVRPVPMRVHISGYPGRHYCPRMATMNKPTYNAIVEKSPTKPVLVFVSSRRQTRLTAMALINFLLLEQNTAKFVRMTVEEVVHTLTLIQDPHVKHCVQFGIGIHHAGLAEGDKAVMEDLFRTGKLQILVATSTLAWGVNFPAHLVIVKGTEYYDGKTKSYIDYPITDVLQMIGRAGRPQFDTEGIAQVLCHEPKKPFYRKFLYDPFPVESALHKQLHAHINAEIVAGTISTRQDAVDYLTWTYLFRRLVKNPSYYGLEDPSPKALTMFLSGLVQKILYDLEAAKCLEPPPDPEEEPDVDPDALRFTVLGKICSYYYMSHQTAALFDTEIGPSNSHIALLKLMCEAKEFDELPVRHNEDKLNMELAANVPLPIDARNADSPHVKAFLLFQAHFQRARLPISDYITDQKSAMDNSVRIIQSMVDIAANNGHLVSALRCMTLLQCIVQGTWWYESTLTQLPHITPAICRDLAVVGINDVADLANATVQTINKLRHVLLLETHGLTEEHVEEVMYAVHRLPLVDVQVSLSRQHGGEPGGVDDEEDGEDVDEVSFEVNVELTRLSIPTKAIVAPRFSKAKDEQYWIVIGNEATGELVAIKRVNRLWKRAGCTLRFDWDDDWVESSRDGGASVELQVYIVCDSFIGLDQQYTIIVRR